MGKQFRVLCPMDTRKLLLIMGVSFAVVLVAQYVELPYVNFFSSLFSSTMTKGSVLAGVSSSSSEMVVNTTLIFDLNSTDANAAHETTANSTEITNLVNRTDNEVNSTGKDKNSSADFVGVSDNSRVHNESASDKVVQLNQNFTQVNLTGSDNGSATQNGGEPQRAFFVNNFTKDNNSLVDKHMAESPREEEKSGLLQNFNSSTQNISSVNFEPEDVKSSDNGSKTQKGGEPQRSFLVDNLMKDNKSTADKHIVESLREEEKSGLLQNVDSAMHNNSSVSRGPEVKKSSEVSTPAVISIYEMNNLLLQSRASQLLMRPQWSSAVDQELLYAKSQIENAPILKNDPRLYAPLYKNVSMFKRSYELMEQRLKVYIYREGSKPVFHQPVLKGIYASEGWFMRLLESNKHFVTRNPKKAHLFYLPFSSRMLEETLYVPNSHSHKNLIAYLKNYLDMIVTKYPFWNRTGGADHFLVACHDWAPSETKNIMVNCIRALCNADVKEGFRFEKDVSLPETYVRTPKNLLRDLGGKPLSKRPFLAFYAGSMHGYVRPIILKYWLNKDSDMKIFGRLGNSKGKMNYVRYMQSSKYCLCPKGYEVNSPRVVEAIFFECVPVIISDNFVPPFFEVLNWESFAVFVLEKDIPNLKNILLSIPRKKYLHMQMRVRKVQEHFLWHANPVKYDVFHMILHSIWYKRVFR